MVTKFKTLKGFDRNNLAKDFAKKQLNNGVEVGVRYGEYSEILCKTNPNLKLKAVDPWNVVQGDYRSTVRGEQSQDNSYKKALNRLKSYNCELIKKESIDAVKDIPYKSLDFVYIDGSHEFDWVMVDIIEWGKRIRKGGIISGHDYYKFRVGNVVESVNLYTDVHKIPLVYLTDERTPSWWFKKKW